MCQVIETLLGNSLRLEFPVSLLGAEYNLGDSVNQSESCNGPARPIRGLTRSACNARSALAFISPDPAGNRDCEGPSPLLSRYHPVYDENGFKCQPPTGKGIEANDDDEVPSLVPEESVQIRCEGCAVSGCLHSANREETKELYSANVCCSSGCIMTHQDVDNYRAGSC